MGKSRKNKRSKRGNECLSSPTSPPQNTPKRINMSKTPENRNTPEQETVDEGAAMAEQALPSNAPVGTPEWAKPLYMELRDIKSHLKQSDQRTADAIKDVYGQLRSAKNDICELQERSKEQEDKIVNLSRNISKLSLENKSLKDKLVRLEAYNRRSNLLITGIEESRTASDDDCRRIAYKCMSESVFQKVTKY